MPKRKKLTEPEAHAMIVVDAKMRFGCKSDAKLQVNSPFIPAPNRFQFENGSKVRVVERQRL